MGLISWHLSDHFHQMPTDFMTWKEMYGNGAVTFTDLIIIKPAKKKIRKVPQTVLIPMSRVLLKELFEVVPFYAVISIAFVIKPGVVEKVK